MATRKGSDDGAAPVGELSYSDAGAELDGIIAEFETGVVDVDRLVDQLERATEIVDELDRRLQGHPHAGGGAGPAPRGHRPG